MPNDHQHLGSTSVPVPLFLPHKLGRRLQCRAPSWCKPDVACPKKRWVEMLKHHQDQMVSSENGSSDIPKRASLIGKMMENEVLNSIQFWFWFLPPRPSRRISSSDDQVPIRHLTFTMFFVLPCVRALRQGTSPCLEDLLRFLSPALLWPVIYMKRPSFTSSTCCEKSIKKW